MKKNLFGCKRHVLGAFPSEAPLAIDRSELKRIAGSFFNGEIGRRYWAAFGNPWMASGDRQTDEFQEIFAAALERAVSDGPPSVHRGADGEGAAGAVARVQEVT